jgi:hypothetical protein
VEILKDYIDVVHQYCRPSRAKSHGVRKGSATYGTSGATCPPPLPAVAKIGKWLQGTVFNIYLLFAEPGENYLRRLLAGLDPNSGNFIVLLLHFDLSPGRSPGYSRSTVNLLWKYSTHIRGYKWRACGCFYTSTHRGHTSHLTWATPFGLSGQFNWYRRLSRQFKNKGKQ